MDERTLKALLAIGFTYEDLYNKGFLVLKSTNNEPAPAQAEPAPAQAEPAPAQAEPAPAQAEPAITHADLEKLKSEMLVLIQGKNKETDIINNMPKEMSLEDAVEQLMKGV